MKRFSQDLSKFPFNYLRFYLFRVKTSNRFALCVTIQIFILFGSDEIQKKPQHH